MSDGGLAGLIRPTKTFFPFFPFSKDLSKLPDDGTMYLFRPTTFIVLSLYRFIELLNEAVGKRPFGPMPTYAICRDLKNAVIDNVIKVPGDSQGHFNIEFIVVEPVPAMLAIKGRGEGTIVA